jgi:uncharacterized protein
MLLVDDAVVLSATDLNNFLACEHLTTLELQILRGELQRAVERPAQSVLLSRLGDEHEQVYLQKLLAQGRPVTTIERPGSSHEIERAAAETERAMARGDEVIYQAAFFDGVSLAYADFLVKIAEPLHGGRWPWHYEVEDSLPITANTWDASKVRRR